MDCQYCRKKFKTTSSLNYHQKTTRYCLKIQKEQGVENKEAEEYHYECQICLKKFSKKYFETHFKSSCGVDVFKVNTLLKELNTTIKDLKDNHATLKDNHAKLLDDNSKLIDIKKENDITMKIIDKISTTNKVIKPCFDKPLVLNDITIIARPEDGYINATELCKAGKKRLEHYKENKQTQEYLQVLSSVTGIPITELIEVKQGGVNQGTWVHRKVAIHLAQWISADFSVKVSSWIEELMLTGRVELGKEKSNSELETIYENKIKNLTNKLKDYESTIFNRNTDTCPIEFYRKDIVYFFKFEIPPELYSSYIDDYPNIGNESYKCIEFGVTSNIEERVKSHKRDKKKHDLVFLHAIEFSKRYTASKMEFYVKRIAKQLNINFDYEKKKECILVDEHKFNVLINNINKGIDNVEDTDVESDSESYQEEEVPEKKHNTGSKNIDNEVEIHKIDREFEINMQKLDKKVQSITEMFKNKLISIEDYKELISSF